MTDSLSQLAASIVEDPAYRETLRTRAHAGTLPEAIELFLLETADGRVPLTLDRPPAQSHTLALVRPATLNEEVQP